MSIRTFMFAADALRLEKGVGFHVETAPGLTGPRVDTPQDVKARNDQAMAAFSAMMGGVKKGRGRRR